jgi:hypothetical protein
MAVLAVTVACGSPSLAGARVGSAEAAVREAKESGAERSSQAAIHLALAQQQIAAARRALDDGELDRAEWLLVRAEADAALATALSREEAQRAAADAAGTEARRIAGAGDHRR